MINYETHDFTKFNFDINLPDLLAIQVSSWKDFLQEDVLPEKVHNQLVQGWPRFYHFNPVKNIYKASISYNNQTYLFSINYNNSINCMLALIRSLFSPCKKILLDKIGQLGSLHKIHKLICAFGALL